MQLEHSQQESDAVVFTTSWLADREGRPMVSIIFKRAQHYSSVRLFSELPVNAFGSEPGVLEYYNFCKDRIAMKLDALVAIA
ncbi:MAG: hypothetical protein ACREOO_03555 [bacterium]